MENNNFKFELKSSEISEDKFEEILDFNISVENIDNNNHIDYYYKAINLKNDYKISIQNIIIAIKLNGKKIEYYIFLLDMLLELKNVLLEFKKELEEEFNTSLNKNSIKKISQKSFQCSLILIQITTLVEKIRDIFIKNNFYDYEKEKLITKFINFYNK